MLKIGLGMNSIKNKEDSPLVIDGCTLYCDIIDSARTGTDAEVSGWEDLSGNNNDLVMDENEDNYLYTAIGYGGLPAIRKQSNGSSLQNFNNVFYDQGGSVTVKVAFRIKAGSNSSSVFYPMDFVRAGALPTITPAGAFYYDDDSSNANIEAGTNVLANDWNRLHIATVMINSKASTSSWIEINGVRSALFEPDTAYSSTNQALRFGFGTGIVEYHRILAYNTEITNAENDYLNRGILKRYNKPLTNIKSFGLVGDSQAEGRASITTRYFDNEERSWMVRNDLVLQRIADPVDDDTGAFSGFMDSGSEAYGIGRTLASDLAEGNAINPIIVPAARGGRSAVEWDDRNASNPFDTTTHYGCTLTVLNNKKASLEFVTVFLGTNDVLDENTPANTEAALESIVTNLRTDLELPSLKFYLVGLHKWVQAIETSNATATEVAWNAIDAAISSAASDLSNCTFIDASAQDGIVGDELHIDAAGYANISTSIVTDYNS